MKKDFIRNFLVIVISFLFGKKTGIRVLALHDIEPDQAKEFERKMVWVKSFANIVSLNDVFKDKNLDCNKLNIAITFDDGFECFSSTVAPILQKLSIPATFFVSSSAIGLTGIEAENFSHKNLKRSKVFKFMSKDQLIELSQNTLFQIGGHTHSHIDLGRVYTKEELLIEINQDKKEIEEMIGKPVELFAYPFGGVANICEESGEAIRKAGYKAAFTILPSFWSEDDNLFFIGRDSLTLKESDSVWRAWLSGGYDVLSKVKNKLT